MRVLLLTSAPGQAYLGARATVQRYRMGLQKLGHLVEVFGDDADGGIKQSLEGTIERFQPDIVHAHDAFLTGIPLLGLRTPWVVSVSGEDLHQHVLAPKTGPLVCEVFRRAHRVMVPGEEARALLEARVPQAVGRIDVVPRAIERLEPGGTDLRRSLGIPHKRFLILLPGGLRAVKGQKRALSLVRTLRANGADAEMIVIGPEQDPVYAQELRELAANEPGVRILPALSRERMGAAYADADVVLVTSESEGMSPVVLEAGGLGRPVVASDVPGNRELLRHKETALLFDDEESMARCCLALHRNRSAAGALGVRLREDLGRRFGRDLELDRLLSSYAAA